MNRKEGSEAPKQERTSRKGRRKRRAACNDTWSDKTKRRIGKKNAAEQKQKFLKKDRQGRKTKKRKGEANIQNRTSMDGEEKSEQLTSEYGFRNFSRNSLMGEKEEDTEAKTQKETPGRTNKVRAEWKDRQTANRRKQNQETIKKARKTTPGNRRSSTEQARREARNPELAQVIATAAKKGKRSIEKIQQNGANIKQKKRNLGRV